jgi:uncharacterized protein YhaN
VKTAKEEVVRAKNALLLALVVVLALMTVAVAACGGDEEAKAALRTALDKVDQDIKALTTQFTSGGTVADVKAAKAQFAGDWEAVIKAAEGVKGADVQAAKDAWTTASTAIDNMDESQPLMQEGLKIMSSVQALTTQAVHVASVALLPAAASVC